MEPLFIGKDLQLIQNLRYDPALTPSFEGLRGCLIWDDERPDGLSPEAYNYLSSLWGARSLLHKGLSLSDHPINPEYATDIWQRALKQVPNWPGFKRLKLTEKDAQYLQHEENELHSSDSI
jgi:hypothetical protein